MDTGGRLPWGFTAGRWWRFDRYQVSGGYIRPAAGARLEEYDPWEPHRELRAGQTNVPAPYESLLNLLTELTVDSAEGTGGQPYTLSAAGEARLAAWCSEFGLLGLLPHQAHQVILAPRWGRSALGDLGWGLAPLRRWYVRGPLGWTWREEIYWQTRSAALENAPTAAGALVPADLLPDAGRGGSVLLQSLDDAPGWRLESLAGTWARYFPDVPAAERDSFAYPQPGTEDFWLLYAEPVDAFLRAAAQLRAVVSNLVRRADATEEDQGYLYRLGKGLEDLQSLLTAVTPALLPLGHGTYLQQWLSRSLLGTVAMMVYLDLSERCRVFVCARCGKIFTSGAYQARYCSERCRYAAQKRAYRGRVRARTLQRRVGEGEPPG